VVAYLGELKRGEQSGWARLGRNLSGQEKPRVWLFAPPRDDDPAVLWKRYIQLTDVEWAFRITARGVCVSFVGRGLGVVGPRNFASRRVR
jgi:hypothetical protein